jgi:serine protease AprX
MLRPTGVVSLLLALMLVLPARGQNSPHSRTWVFFGDRGISSTAASPAELGITDRSLKRRAKVLPPDRLIDERDDPVSEEYLSALRAAGATVRSVSRWLNAASVEASPDQLASIRALPFVAAQQPVRVARRTPPVLVPAPDVFLKRAETTDLDYGNSLTQSDNIHIPPVHALGINGAGVVVGMIDDGFNNHRVHSGLKRIHVIAEYDFINRDSSTTRSANESSAQGNHGAATLSILGGFENGRLVAPAYASSFILAKTEIVTSETQVEEDLFVEALEWMERMGADVVSASLGYFDWYTYPHMDGKTAVTTNGVRIAVQKGILIVNSMGNEGWFRPGTNSTGTMGAPADADSILSVGAAQPSGLLASFSSTGPTFDGRVKPEVVAQGTNVTAALGTTSDGYSGNFAGTSASAPLVAGVAALVLSARPELTPYQVRQTMIQTAVPVNDPPRTNTTPNNYYGWGWVHAYNAVMANGTVFSSRPLVLADNGGLRIFTSIASPSALMADSLFLYYQTAPGGPFQQVQLTPSRRANEFTATITAAVTPTHPRGYFTSHNAAGESRRSPFNAPDSLFYLGPTPDSLITHYPSLPASSVPDQFILHTNYPNPFNNGTVIRFDAPRTEAVELSVYTLLGQHVRTLFAGIAKAGENRFTWNGTNDAGIPAASGVYLLRLKTASSTLSTRMVFLR